MTTLEFKKTCYNRFKQTSKLQDIIAFIEMMITYIHSLLYHYVFHTMTIYDIKLHLQDFVNVVNVESNRLVKLYNSKFPNIKLIGYRLHAIINDGREFKSRNIANQIKDECNICCEMTKVFECDECKYKCCVECFDQVTLSSINEAVCINCQVYFDRNVLVNKLGKSWYEKKYKLHLYELLFQREEIQFEKSCEFYRLQQDRDRLYKEWKYLVYKEYTEKFPRF